MNQDSAPAKKNIFRRRPFLCAAGIIALSLIAVASWAHHRWYACLPQLDGTNTLRGLSTAVSIERDALGIPTIKAGSRLDAMRALGWLHAQDRFFQMDLLRRSAAGELAELFGKKALPADKEVRVHDLRNFAKQAVVRLPADQKALVAAYTEGVNAGLAALGAPPWEYAVLRADAQPWLEEDSILVGYSIALSLQDAGRYDRSLYTLREELGESAARFFAPVLCPDDAAVDGSTEPLAPIPGPKSINLRKPPEAKTPELARAENVDAPHAGSNAFALAGRFSRNGAALVANDMHLELAVPTTWYRVVLSWKQPSDTWVGGISLPGTPGIIAGSNRHVAWGFTHCPADTADLINIIPEPEAETLYRRQNDLGRYEARKAIIRVKGDSDVTHTTQWTDWGPVVGKGEMGRPLVLAWTAHSPEAIDFTLVDMASAQNANEAVSIAQRSGLPALNCIIADNAGAIAWTVAGRLPKRIGYDGRHPSFRIFGDRRWEGFLPAKDYPKLIAPANGWIASANERMWGGETLALLGDGGYASTPRVRQIQTAIQSVAERAGANAEAKASPSDLLAIQLDDRAEFLKRWRELALRLLKSESSGNRAEFRRLVETWNGRASASSQGHLLLREFRRHASNRILSPIFEACSDADAKFRWRRFRYDPALWALIETQPIHLLAPKYADWDSLLLAAIDDAIADATKNGRPLAKATWGESNKTRIQHPIARALPSWMSGFLSMPETPQAGDNQMPRVAAPSFGASERFVVSPGYENEGICHLPGGQCGHPSSPFFRAGFSAWANGEPSPFLPGPTVHTLSLSPDTRK